MREGILPYAKSRLSEIRVFTCFFVKTYGGFIWKCVSMRNLRRCRNGTQKFSFKDHVEEKRRLRIERLFYQVLTEARAMACREQLSEKMDVIRRQNFANFGIDAFFVSSFANGGLFIG